MDTAHIRLPSNTIKNLRIDAQLDDGSHFIIEDDKEYGVQAIGGHDVKITSRATSRGVPDLESDDVVVVANKVMVYVQTKPDENYYIWSEGQDSIVGVNEIEW